MLAGARLIPARLLPVVDGCHGDDAATTAEPRVTGAAVGVRNERPIKKTKTSFSLLKFHQSVRSRDCRARSADAAGQEFGKSRSRLAAIGEERLEGSRQNKKYSRKVQIPEKSTVAKYLYLVPSQILICD